MSPPPGSLRATLLLLLATVFWSLSFTTMRALLLAQQVALPGTGTWFISSLCVGLRFGLAAVIMLLWCGATIRRLTGLEVWQGAGLGVFGSLGLILQMDGLAYTTASTSAFLTQCYCLIIPLWVTIIDRRWPSPLVLTSCALVMVGVAVLSRVSWGDLRLQRGEWETLLASVFFTGQILWLQRPAFARNDANHFSLVMFVVMAIVGVLLAAGSQHAPGDWFTAYTSAGSWALMGLLVVFSTLGGYLLMNHWQPLVSATEAGLIYCAEPVFVSLSAVFLPAWMGWLAGVDYPNETLDRSLLIGGGLITLANVLIQAGPWLANRARPAAAEHVGP